MIVEALERIGRKGSEGGDLTDASPTYELFELYGLDVKDFLAGVQLAAMASLTTVASGERDTPGLDTLMLIFFAGVEVGRDQAREEPRP